MCSVTILAAKGHCNLCKMITQQGIMSYDNAKFFKGDSVDIKNLIVLKVILQSIKDFPNKAIILGNIRKEVDRNSMRRLLVDQIDCPTTIEAVLKYWFPIDMDIEDEAAGDSIDYALSLLPKEFHDCAVVIQFTSSHGIKKGIRLRLFFWLEEPLMPSQMALVLRDTKDADKAIYNANQPIYTATPIFVGVEDPVPERIVYRDGGLLRPHILEPESRSMHSISKSFTANNKAGKGYQDYRDLIGEDGFYEPLKQAVGSYFRTTNEPDLFWLEEDLTEAILAKAHLRDPEYIQFRLNDLPKLIAAIAGREESKAVMHLKNINELRKKIGI